MEFSRPEYWSGLPFPSPRDFPNPGIESGSLALQADSLPAEPQGKPYVLFFKCLFYNDYRYTAATAKSLQLCPTLCDSIDGSPPGSTVPGIHQARMLEWVAISFSNA